MPTVRRRVAISPYQRWTCFCVCFMLATFAETVPSLAGEDCNGNGILDHIETRLRYSVQSVSGGGPIYAIDDIDGDGDPDLLLSNAWLENLDGLGNFGPPQATFVPEPGVGTLSVLSADLDGDGDGDILRYSLHSNEERWLSWHENLDGQGQYGPRNLLAVLIRGANIWDTMGNYDAADLDGDGDSEVVLCYARDHLSAGDHRLRVYVYENDSGQLTGSVVYSTFFSWYGWEWNSCFVADFNGDGAPDIGIYHALPGDLFWLPNDGAGSFGAPVVVGLPEDFEDEYEFHARDLDGDGDPDILRRECAFRDDTDEVQLYDNTDGYGGFSDPTPVSHPQQCQFEAWDLDADGDTDLIEIDGGLVWRENIGTGFADPRLLGSMVPAYFFASPSPPVDIDGDGSLDLGSVSAWLRNESGDCNSNDIPDECEPDCNANGRADACDIRDGFGVDCNGNGEPDECETGCSETCDADGDRCVDLLDADPLDPTACGDVDADGCDDCSGGAFDLAQDGPNSDVDGICDVGDCAPMDNRAWFEPKSATGLVASMSGTTTTWTWESPSPAGGFVLRYDTLRSSSASDFSDPANAVCIGYDQLDRESVSEQTPPPGVAWHYLIRVENGCPGEGAMGSGSDGVPRSGVPCG